jgi:adenine phosphoribosyltransferase
MKNLELKIRKIPDFPKKGIVFWDLTTLFRDKNAFRQMINVFVKRYKTYTLDYVACIESRGFVIGSVLAYLLHTGLVIIRKKGKLPHQVICEDYEKEYGLDTIEMHNDAVKKGDRVLLVDDLLATGNTALAAAHLIEKAQGKIIECAFIVELVDFSARTNQLKNYPVYSIIQSRESD